MLQPLYFISTVRLAAVFHIRSRLSFKLKKSNCSPIAFPIKLRYLMSNKAVVQYFFFTADKHSISCSIKLSCPGGPLSLMFYQVNEFYVWCGVFVIPCPVKLLYFISVKTLYAFAFHVHMSHCRNDAQ